MALASIGGAFLAASVKILMDKLTSPEFRGYFKDTKLNEPLMGNMRTTLLALEVVLEDADVKQILDPKINHWLDLLTDAIFDAEDLFNQISYNALRYKVKKKDLADHLKDRAENFYSTKNSNKNINSEMEKIYKTLQLFVQQSSFLGLQPTARGAVSDRTPSSSVVNESFIVGRNDDKKKLVKMLQSDSGTSNNLGVVAIWGMGGVGKTTLAQLVYNDTHVPFELKAWVCVSPNFDTVRVTKLLLESAARNTTSTSSNVWESDNLDILRVELKKISNGKKFLFVLDDLWNDSYNDWTDLLSPLIGGAPGSSVIITTRHGDVAKLAPASTIHELKPLLDEDCWSLLSKHALGSDKFQDKDLEDTSWEIAKKCGGLPIAAKTLGGLLRSKVDKDEWTSILNSKVWNLPKDNIIPALRLSYQYLPSHLKACFAYCSIFPKGIALDRKKLILLWMAAGFLDCYQGRKAAEELGDDYFVELLSRSLIQQSNDGARGKVFLMHDLVNDLATVVSGKSCSKLECGDISKNVHHILYNQELYDVFKKFENIYNFKLLQSFLSRAHRYSKSHISIKVVEDFLPTLKMLRALSLSNYAITKLPDTIGSLLQLRYLDLSYTKIKSLPDTTCDLYNLQTLNLSSCTDLTKLPLHMGNLINLRHLDIIDTNLKELPMEIARLENFQTLTVFVVGKQHGGLSIKELRKFPNLQGKLTIKNLHNVVDATEAEDANLKSKEKIEELKLLWGKEKEDSKKVKMVLAMLEPPTSLKSLNIGLYDGTSFPSWLGDSSFSNMVSLRINNCEYCTTLPPLGQLPSLKELEIHGMEILETIGLEFYHAQPGKDLNSFFQPFPSLERIKFDSMPNWREWVDFEGKNFAFPRLRTMELLNCPELRGHLPSHLPCIEEIVIEDCAHLETPSTSHGTENDGRRGSTQVQRSSSVDGHVEMTESATLDKDSKGKKKVEEIGQVGKINDGMGGSTQVQGSSSDGNAERTESATLDNDSKGKKQVGEIEQLEKIEDGRIRSTQVSGLSSIKELKIGGAAQWTDNSKGKDGEIIGGTAYSYVQNFIPGCTHLQHLKLYRLSILTAFPSSGLPTSLQSLSIDECENLSFLPPEKWSNYTSLWGLQLKRSCGELTSFQLDGFPALQRLEIYECRNLGSICISEDPPSRPSNLQLLTIRCLDKSPLTVDLKMDTLTALKYLWLDCEAQLSFSKGVCLPPKLQEMLYLNYRGRNTETPVTEWGFKSLTALSVLTIISNDDIVHTLMNNSLLPISLVSLTIANQEMRSFDVSGLQHLSSLKNLNFKKCIKLESFVFPENLPRIPSSLQSLAFIICPALVSLPTNLLPTTLKTLQIEECEKLKSLPEDRLNSLNFMVIEKCRLLKERYKSKKHLSNIARILVLKGEGQVTIQ